MSDNKNDSLAVNSGGTSASANGAIKPAATGVRIGLPKLHQRVAKAEASQMRVNPLTLPNRISLMLDISGSMSESAQGRSKIEHLKDAIQGFLTACDFSTTSVSLDTFPSRGVAIDLTVVQPILLTTTLSLTAGGGTPMAQAMDLVLNMRSLTRGVIVSDGEADGAQAAREVARQFASAEIVVDCVHIGDSVGGEGLLKEIAEITHGLFIKFDNVSNFSKAFKYLTPSFRGMLTSGGAAELIGAKEVK